MSYIIPMLMLEWQKPVLVYMKGDQAHAGFPELAYGKYVEALVCHSA